MYPGEYIQPLPRKHFVQCAVVSGYVGARLQAEDWPPAVVSGPPTGMAVIWENVGGTQFSVLLRETDDRSVSGTRYNLSAGVNLVPGGMTGEALTTGRPCHFSCAQTASPSPH